MSLKNAVGVLLFSLGVISAHTQSTPPLTLQRKIPLPMGISKFDHFAVDLIAHRLFIGGEVHGVPGLLGSQASLPASS